MELDLQKWLPLGIIIGLSIVFINMASPSVSTDEEDAPKAIVLPKPESEYEPPANVRVPFEYDQVISTRPVVEAAPVIGEDGKPAPVAPVKKEKRVFVSLEGILWIQNAPMASINGRIMAEGETYKNIHVISISTTQVKLKVGNEIIVKSVK